MKIITIAAIVTGLTASLLHAASVTFINPSGGLWSDGANWNNNTGPAADDSALLTGITNGSYVVNYDTASGSAPWNLQISNGAGYFTTLNINAAGFNTAFTDNTVITRGIVNINSGGNWNLNNGQLSIDQGSTVYVNGGTLTTSSTNTKNISVGHSLTISNTVAKLQLDDGNIDFSAGNSWVQVGSFSKGLVEINGGTFKADSLFVASGASGANSKLLVTGGILNLVNTGFAFSVGQAANGTVEMTGGTVTNKGGLRIATQSSGVTGVVTQDGGTWKQEANVDIASITGSGSNSTGTFNLKSGSFAMTNAAHTLQMSVGNTTQPNAVGVFNKEGGTLVLDNLVINGTGYLTSAAAQTWTFYGNFINNSTKNTLFDTTGATFQFTGNRAHAFTVAGADFGNEDLAGYNNNFALDSLQLMGSSDTITFSLASGNTNALYLNALLLPGNDTSLIGTNLIGLDGLTIYYLATDARNAYLGGSTYNLANGGFLMAVPEPGSISLLCMALGILMLTAIRRKRSLGRLPRKSCTPLFLVFLSCALLSVSAFSASASITEEDQNTVFLNNLSPEDHFEMVDLQQPKEFADGPVPDSKALCLKPTTEPKSGVFFSLDTTRLSDGTAEIWFKLEEETSPEAPARVILNLGSAGNTKWRIETRGSRVQVVFPQADTKNLFWKSDPIEAGTWHHVALTWSAAAGAKFFIDGVCEGESKEPATLWNFAPKEHLHVGDAPEWSEDTGYGWFNDSNNLIGCVAGLRISDIARENFPKSVTR